MERLKSTWWIRNAVERNSRGMARACHPYFFVLSSLPCPSLSYTDPSWSRPATWCAIFSLERLTENAYCVYSVKVALGKVPAPVSARAMSNDASMTSPIHLHVEPGYGVNLV